MALQQPTTYAAVLPDFLHTQVPRGTSHSAVAAHDGATHGQITHEVLVRPRLVLTAKHPHLAAYEARLLTFRGWPLAMPQRPRELAEAGFFYPGRGDQVNCFCCDIGVKDWTPTASPWEEHAYMTAWCEYLDLCKGWAFVNEVKLKYEARPQSMDVSPSPNAQELGRSDFGRGAVLLPCGHHVACPQCAAPQCPGFVWVMTPINPPAIQPNQPNTLAI